MLRVLVADDDETTRRILDKALKSWGYQTIICPDGTSAWDVLSSNQLPDITILDWYMPEITGPEIVEAYKKLENPKFIYHIILSGHFNKESIIEAIHKGVHDVMEKPCDLNFINSRLQVAASILREKRAVEHMADTMQRYAEQMESLANERAKQLVHADRMSSLGVMAAGVAHEINNPMSFVAGNAQNLRNYWQVIAPIIKQNIEHYPDNKSKLEFILSETPLAIESILNGSERVTAIVKSLKKYSVRQKANEKELFDLNTAILQAIEMCKGHLGKDVKIDLNLDKRLNPISGNSIEMEQVFVNLVVNATQAMKDKETKILTINTTQTEFGIKVRVVDSGPGIPAELLTKIWDPFFTTKAVGIGTGLGLSISNGIVKDHGGNITARNRPEGGAEFEIEIPVRKVSSAGGLQ